MNAAATGAGSKFCLVGRVRPAELALGVSAAATTVALVRGGHLATGAYFVLLLVGYVALGVYLVAVRRSGNGRAWPVLVASGVLLVAAMIQPPFESADAYSYASYGRMVVHYHENPWTHSPSDHPRDNVTQPVPRIWRTTPSVYGPAFIPPAVVVMAVAGDSLLLSRLGFQLLAALAVAAAMWLIGRETNWSPGALAVIGLNPLIAISVVNGAHNDAWCGALLLVAVVLANRRRWALAGVVVGVAAAVKITAILAVLGLGVWAWRQAGRSAAAKVAVAAGAVTGGVVLLAGGETVVRAMTWNSWRMTDSTAWGRARPWLLPDHFTQTAQGRLATYAMLTVVALAALLVLRHRRASSSAVLVGLVFTAYLLVSAYVWPWYAVWGLIPLALNWWSPTGRFLMGVGMLLHLAAVTAVHDMTHTSARWHAPFRAAEWLAMALPWILIGLTATVLVWSSIRWRTGRATPSARAVVGASADG
ncbi:MAG: putative integral rane protein [Acidimicrobiales bacterium]|nr:putative integral rane protein [Acidimicrobiales bacterium]